MNIIVLTSAVPKHNASPVEVHKKLLNLCYQSFDSTSFICANYPEEELACFDQSRFNYLEYSSPKGSSRKSDIFNYIKNQFKIPKLIKRGYTKGSFIMFWLAGPMIIPFLYCKLKGFKTVGFLYGNSRLKSDKTTMINNVIAMITEFIARKSTVTCVEAPGVASHWGYDVKKDNIQTVHLYVDTEKFSPKIAYKERENIIGMCCRLVESKKVLESIEAFTLLEKDFPDWTLEIAGTGFLYNDCDKLIKKLQQTKRIKLLGWIDNSDMPEYYSRWKILLNPTNYEGLPNSILESLACATPPLTSMVGGIPDVVNESSGWELKGKSTQEIQVQIGELLKRQGSEEKSRQGRLFIEESYNFESSLEDFKKFSEILKNKM